MSPYAYTEDQLIEQPAIGPLSALGWQSLWAIEDIFGTIAVKAVGELVP